SFHAPNLGLSLSVALLELLATAAPAGIVATNLRLVATHRLDGGVVAAGARRARGRAGDRSGLHAGGRRTSAAVGEGRRASRWSRRCGQGADVSGATGRRSAGPADNGTQPPEIPHHLVVDPILHRLEEREALFLVLDERIALAVAAQADAFLEVIEAVEVVLPLLIDDLQHEVAFDPAEQGRIGQEPFLLLVGGHGHRL